MNLQFTGKSVLIIGGARGIGYASAIRFAQAGAKVAIADINVEQAQSSAARLAKETGAITLEPVMDLR